MKIDTDFYYDPGDEFDGEDFTEEVPPENPKDCGCGAV